MEKVAPSERFRQELDEVLAGVGEEQDPIETVGRLGARLILQQVLEDEVTEFLGRRRYERAGETVSRLTCQRTYSKPARQCAKTVTRRVYGEWATLDCTNICSYPIGSDSGRRVMQQAIRAEAV